MGTRQRLTPTTLLAVCLFWLAGCQDSGPDNRYETYLERLSRTLEVPLAQPEFNSPPRPPRVGKLQLALSGAKLDPLEFLALSGCAVQVTIGKRNSSLGRMAAPSQRLLLELEFLRLAPDCVTAMREAGRETLAADLQRAWEAKRGQLPELIFNATLGGEEYRAFWSSSGLPGEYPAVSGGVSLLALGAITAHSARWLAGDFTADNREFEILLGEVAGGDGGTLLRSMLRQRDWLRAADSMLTARRARGPLCGPGIRFDTADILPAVVRRIFVGEIQPAAAIESRRYYELITPIADLEARLAGTLPPLYRQWQTERDAAFSAALAAPRAHVEEIKAILGPCEAAVDDARENAE